MKAIKYLLAGALMIGLSTPTMAQDVKSEVNAITKVIVSNKNNLEAVKDQIKTFYKEYKKNPEALVGLGRAYLEIKDTANAKKYADEAIKRDKNYGDGYILEGDIEVIKNDGGEAARWYQQAIYFEPKNPQGYIKYANIYRGRSPEEAVSKLEELRKVLPTYPVDAEAGHFFYQANKFSKAIEYYDKVDKSKLTDVQLTEFALAAYLNQNQDKSLEVASYGSNKFPRSAALNRLTFYNYTDKKDYVNALKFADALFTKSDSAKISYADYQYRGLAYMGSGDYDSAIDMFNKVLDVNKGENADKKTNQDAVKMLSEAYMGKKDYTNALALYERYISMKGELSVSDFDELAGLYTEAAQASTGAQQKEFYKKADATYGNLAEKYPNNEAYANFMRARINSYMDPETSEGLAQPYYAKFASILEANTQRTESDNKMLIEAYRYLGYFNYLKKNKALADSYWNKILKIDPENETAKQALGIK